MSPWDVPEVDQPPDTFSEVPEGWFALVAWAVGPENLRRMPRPRERDATRTVRVVITSGDEDRRSRVPFSASDRLSVDESAEDTLRRCGLPPQPRGYVWLVRDPPGLGIQDLIRAVLTEEAQEALAREPHQVAGLARDAAAALYAQRPA
jgi:hypothetical protein